MFKTIDQIESLESKRVFLRTDFNVPMKDGKITDNNRIVESLPTIRYLLERKARIIIGSHLGRPDGKKNTESSLLPVAKELEKLLALPVKLSPEVTGEISRKLVSELSDGEILLLENLRWEKGEESGDDRFAEELAGLAEIYVNDAFAVSHRPHASVYLIAKKLPCFAGLLLKKEIGSLGRLTENPAKPFIVILGGAKIADKIGMVDHLASKADRFLIGGAMANTFLKAAGENVSESVYEPESVEKAKSYLKNYEGKIVIPLDQVKERTEGAYKIYDIGDKTIEEFEKIINQAKTVFWNGCLGYTEDDRYRKGTDSIAKAITENKNCFSVLAGGDTVGEVSRAGYKDKFSFVSTGGGAALEFLSGKKLPGIEVLEKND